jgi:hypothetical protein
MQDRRLSLRRTEPPRGFQQIVYHGPRGVEIVADAAVPPGEVWVVESRDATERTVSLRQEYSGEWATSAPDAPPGEPLTLDNLQRAMDQVRDATRAQVGEYRSFLDNIRRRLREMGS